MSIRLPRSFAASLGALLAVSCSNPVCGCLTLPPYAIVHGRVATPEGAGAGGAQLFAETGDAACAGVMPAGQGVSRPDGSYELMVHAMRAVQPEDCVRVYALAPADAAPAASDTVRVAVRFSESPPIDSVRVDLVLRAR